MAKVKTRGYEKPVQTKRTISRILKYMGSFKALWLLVFACVVTSSLAGVLGNYMIRPAINDYILPFVGKENVDLSGFAALLKKVMCVFVLGAFCTWANARLMLYISTKLLYKIRVDLFEHLETLPINYYDAHTHGELMSRFTSDTDTLREMFSSTIPHLMSSAITLVSAFAMMVYLSPLLTVLVVVTVVLMTLCSAAIAKKSAASFREQQKSIASVNGYIEEMMEGQKVVKIFNREEIVKKEFAELSDNLRKAGTAANTYGAILHPINHNFSHIQYAIVAIAGAAMVIASDANPNITPLLFLDLGTIAAFLQYTRSFSQPISMMSQQANSILNALAGAERIFNIIDEESEIDEGNFSLVNAYEATDRDGKKRLVQSFGFTGEWAWKNAADNSLVRQRGDVVFDNVVFGYTPKKNVLHKIKIHAKPGQKIALVGSTGSGKTTVINLLARFYDVAEENGKILYDGIPLNKIKKDSLRRSLGMVQQATHLFTGTIRENIRYGNLEASDAQIYEAAKLANADNFIRHLPEGYDTVITGDGESLSQGQRQLLSIARAAIADPPVLILDEATSSIDTRTEKLIEQGMDSLMNGRTTFVIAHRLSTVRNADEIIVLEKGKIIERGTHDQLIAKKGRYYFLYTGNSITLAD